MFPKMSFVLGLWLVCGFIANLPTAYSIKCYSCADHRGSTVPCDSSATVIDCQWYFDSCSSLTTTMEFFGQEVTTTVKNCSSAQYGGCDPTSLCDIVNSSVVSGGVGSLKQCHLSCCQSDLCNGKSGAGSGKRAVKNIFAALKNEEQDTIVDELKRNAAELTKKLQTKRGRSKRRAAFSWQQKKREAKSDQLMSDAMKAIQESLAKLVPQKR